MKIGEFLDQLTGVKQVAPDRWQAKCPAHDDNRASLSIAPGEEGRILLKCHANCSVPEICQAMGVKQTELFPPPKPKEANGRPQIIASYDYVDASGALVYQIVRYRPKDFRQRRPNGQGGWLWNMKGVTRIPYNLPACLAAIAAGESIFVVEGEKDVLALQRIGFVGTTNAGGAGKWTPQLSQALPGARVVILPDNDDPGREHAAGVAECFAGIATSVKCIALPDLKLKGDVSDWLAAGHTKEELLDLVTRAQEWKRGPRQQPAADGAPEFALTDLGNAEALVATHGQDLRFCVDRDKWMVWSGCRWIFDEAGEIQRRATDTIRAGYEKLKDISPHRREAVLKHLIKSEHAQRIKAMAELAKFVTPEMPVRADELDGDAWLFNVRNGTIDLRTGELRPHAREDLISRLAPVTYDSTAECRRWLQFLSEVFGGDAGIIEYVARLTGYCLTGSIKEQMLFILLGKGGNGKSVLVETLRHLLGDYGSDAPMTTFTEQRSDTSTAGLAMLCGSRFVSAAEGSGDQVWDEALLKRLTGGDPVTARHLYCSYFTYTPTFKLLVSSNEVPRLRGQGYAIKRRVRIIPFHARFYDPQDGREPVRDPELLSKLLDELPGILNWAIRGCLAWQESGLGLPDAVQAETDKLFGDQDPLLEWLDARCELLPDAATPTSELWTDYQTWCKANNRDSAFKAAHTFSRNLAQRDGIDSTRTKKARIMTGIQLRQGDAEATEDEFAALFPEAGNQLFDDDEDFS